MNARRPLKVCVFGGSPGTGNLGVTALGRSLVSGIARRVEDLKITMFDDGAGTRLGRMHVGGHDLEYSLCGAVGTRRIYRRESQLHIRVAGRLGCCGNPAVAALRGADVVFDISGGDSFTDLYGRRRFRTVALDKIITIEQQAPLILSPQTIGPFRNPGVERTAKRILKSAAMVWTRDPQSYALVRNLLGRDFDCERHRCGIDLAFGLESYRPTRALPAPIEEWLLGGTSRPTVGFNVSGLIFNHAAEARRRFSLLADYRHVVTEFLRRILRETAANVLLIPHVFTERGHFEHDPDACDFVASELGRIDRGRVAVVPRTDDPCEMKWIIGRTDWFCGTRMHSAIAALSSGVPTAAIAYSGKTSGVFETCGQSSHVTDPCAADSDHVIEHLWKSWASRGETRRSLQRAMPSIQMQVGTQLDEMLAYCFRDYGFQSSSIKKAA